MFGQLATSGSFAWCITGQMDAWLGRIVGRVVRGFATSQPIVAGFRRATIQPVTGLGFFERCLGMSMRPVLEGVLESTSRDNWKGGPQTTLEGPLQTSLEGFWRGPSKHPPKPPPNPLQSLEGFWRVFWRGSSKQFCRGFGGVPPNPLQNPLQRPLQRRW